MLWIPITQGVGDNVNFLYCIATKKAKEESFAFFVGDVILFSYVNSSCFSNNGNLNLTWIGHFSLNFLRDIER